MGNTLVVTDEASSYIIRHDLDGSNEVRTPVIDKLFITTDRCVVSYTRTEDDRLSLLYCSCTSTEFKSSVFSCLDCGEDTKPLSHGGIGEYYNVLNGIWWTYVPEFHGMVCLGCLEDRMDRKLTRADFSNAPINTDVPEMSKRFLNRMRAL